MNMSFTLLGVPSVKRDFSSLKAQLLASARRHVPDWLPAGKQRGKEWVVGSLSGEPGDSLSINLDTGVWCDFASGEKGGDLIDLYQAIHGVDPVTAYKELGGDEPRAPVQAAPSPKVIAKPSRKVITPVPQSVDLHGCDHPIHGRPSRTWTYQNASGELLGYVARYDLPDGGKEIVPWTYASSGWGMGQWPEPRPLYGLQHLAARPDAPVLIVEGEKATDAAVAFAGAIYVVVTWPGGGHAWKKADFTPLYGKKLLLWPDADLKTPGSRAMADRLGIAETDVMPQEHQPGWKTMQAIAAALAPHCPEVKVIDPGHVLDRMDGWDAADCGFTKASFKEWAIPRVSVYTPPAVVETPVERLPTVAPAATVVPRHAAASVYGLECNSKGEAFASVANIVRVLQGDESLFRGIWYDEFLGRIMTIWRGIKPREWSDVDDINLQIYLQESLGMPKLGKQTVTDAVQAVAYIDKRNEAQAYIEGLVWDGVSRLDNFLPDIFGTADTEYNRMAGSNFWKSMVARVIRPGCKVDTMLVLEGLQGAGKSKALAIIGGQWFAEAHQSPTDKDFYMNLAGKMLIEIGEMDAFSRAEVNKVKQVITCQTDRFRAPYERRAADHPRRCVFAGTTNRDDWNKDETGARRFWPVDCTSIDHEALVRDRDQFFAEAAARLAAGEGWWDMPADETRAEQEARRDNDTWEDEIQDFLIGRSETTVQCILGDLLSIPIDRQDRALQMRVAKCLRTLGWVRIAHKVFRSGRQIRPWRRKDDLS